MDKFVYLIFSHANPAQVNRLASAICRSSPKGHVVIHHDASKPAFTISNPQFDSRITMIPNPMSVKWGDYSFVEAILHSISWIQKNIEFDWLITISGMDYPISPLTKFENRLSTSNADGFISYFQALDRADWPKGLGLRRYYFNYFELPRFPYYYKVPTVIKEALRALRDFTNLRQSLIRIQPRHRQMPMKVGIRKNHFFSKSFVCYSGSDWFNLKKTSVELIQKSLSDNPLLLRYYRRTILPSESLFHTILVNHPDLSIFNDKCRHIKWEDIYAPSPEVLRSNDFCELSKSRHPFARKFDNSVDEKIFDLLDESLFGINGAACPVDDQDQFMVKN